MSQLIPGQPHPDLQGLGHRHQSPWWSSPRHNALGRTLLNVNHNMLSQGGWKNSFLTDSSQHLLLDLQNLHHRHHRLRYRNPSRCLNDHRGLRAQLPQPSPRRQQAEGEVKGIRRLPHPPQPRLARRRILQRPHQVAVAWRPGSLFRVVAKRQSRVWSADV